LLPELPSLLEEVGDFKRVRHDFYLTCLELFIENWARPYYDYCLQNNLWLTGHYWEHDWPVPRINPDNMALGAYAHMPGIDILMNDWSLDVHAQFGNAGQSGSWPAWPTSSAGSGRFLKPTGPAAGP